jgi:3-methyladenine DNA glycosylase AlkD
MSRQITQVFENYQKARSTFVQTVAELATRQANIEFLQAAGVMALLRPLLLDTVPTVQHTAAIALGRLANANEDLARAVVEGDILPQLVHSLAENNRFYKKAAAFVLRTVAKHSPELAQAVVDSGAVDALVVCLEEFDPSVKESAAWALGYIGRHNAELATAVVDAGAVPLLVNCIQEPEISLKRISASALSDISKHSTELAQSVVDAGAIAYLAVLVENPDAKLKRQVFSALSQISKHTVELAELVVEAEIFPAVLVSLKDLDEYVQKNVATLIREVCKHSPELATMVVNCGGSAALVNFITNSQGIFCMPGIMAIGYIATFTEKLAMQAIVSHAVPPLVDALKNEQIDVVQSAAAWAIGQLGRHSPVHAKHVADANAFPVLIELSKSETSSEDLKNKSTRALQAVLQKCVHLPALEAILVDAPPAIFENVVGQFAKVLPNDTKARKLFVTSGGLKKVQEIKAEPGTQLEESIGIINAAFPAEIVKFYSPGIEASLLERLETYEPAPATAAT